MAVGERYACEELWLPDLVDSGRPKAALPILKKIRAQDRPRTWGRWWLVRYAAISTIGKSMVGVLHGSRL
jgi:hypothetical protein